MTAVLRFGLATGHAFGRAALEGILESRAPLELALAIQVDVARASSTVGYARIDDLVPSGARSIDTTDGSLASLEAAVSDADLDLLLVIGWSHLVTRRVLNLPRGVGDPPLRGVGMHPTALPVGRGGAPIPWTIINGLSTSALSVFELEERADTGAILAQYPVSVGARATSTELFAQFLDLHRRASRDLAGALTSASISRVAQDEAAASRWPKRREAEGEILPSMTTREVDAHVRAMLDPYPGAFVATGAGWRRVVDTRIPPATTRDSGDWIEFACRDGRVERRLGEVRISTGKLPERR